MHMSYVPPCCCFLVDLAARTSRVLEALQLCTLMLPPANRRKLHLLLRFMNKLINNSRLRQLDAVHSNRDMVSVWTCHSWFRSQSCLLLFEPLCVISLLLTRLSAVAAQVLATFAGCVLRSAEPLDLSDVNALLCAQIVCLMADNYSELMRVPQQLKTAVAEQLHAIAAGKVSSNWLIVQNTCTYIYNKSRDLYCT